MAICDELASLGVVGSLLEPCYRFFLLPKKRIDRGLGAAANAILIFIGLTHIRISEGKVFATTMGPRVVNTQYGQLRGVLVTLPNTRLPQVEAYLGLQYASVLGGELRFMPPTSPMEKWDGIRVALRFRPVCPQKLPDLAELRDKLPLGRLDQLERLKPFLEKQAEECLNLNVYVPVLGKSLYTSYNPVCNLYTNYMYNPVCKSVH